MGQTLFVCSAKDSLGDRQLSREEQLNVKKRMTVQRTQFPITGAYAFMDYRSQGQNNFTSNY